MKQQTSIIWQLFVTCVKKGTLKQPYKSYSSKQDLGKVMSSKFFEANIVIHLGDTLYKTNQLCSLKSNSILHWFSKQQLCLGKVNE